MVGIRVSINSVSYPQLTGTKMNLERKYIYLKLTNIIFALWACILSYQYFFHGRKDPISIFTAITSGLGLTLTGLLLKDLKQDDNKK